MAQTVNHYFNTLGGRGEQRLVEDLIVQAIRINGMKVYYIPRTLQKIDPVFGEDPLSKFSNYFNIEMYFDNPAEGFGANGFFMSKFSFEMRDSASFIVSRRRFNQAVLSDGMTPYSIVSPQAVALANWNQMHGITTTSHEVRPMEGDLIYLPITNDVFEISQSEHESVFYQVGYRYIWRISVNKFKYSHEKIQTGVPEIDAVERFFENVDSVDNDPLADNNTFLDRADTTNINKTEKNIFGDVI